MYRRNGWTESDDLGLILCALLTRAKRAQDRPIPSETARAMAHLLAPRATKGTCMYMLVYHITPAH